MAARFNLACVQITATDDVAYNIAETSRLIRQAHASGADLISTPENTGIMAAKGEDTRAAAKPEAEHPALLAYRALAAELRTWLHIGSIGCDVPGETRIANRGFMIRPDGDIAASYDKIHMFDVDLPSGENYRESRRFRPGDRTCLVDLPWGRLGMTICYDMRFPHLYRALAHAGAELLAMPSAFTKPTGQAHWHVLLRARAIECGAYVFAAAQCGTHPGNRKTYGHSLIVAPWGEILADAGEEIGVITASLDLAKVDEARLMVPALRHDRRVDGPAPLPLAD